MNADSLLEHFGRISEAPNAVGRLRRFILDLAVRGTLVEQDPDDEPAAELLKRIQAERLKKAMQPSPVAPEELPFVLPPGWNWTRFGEVFSLEYGDSLPAEKRSNTGEYPVYGSNGVVGSHFECFVNSPCIVVGRKGSAGALNLSLSDGCCVTDVAYYCIPPSGLDMAFSFKLFHTLGLGGLGKGVKPGLSRNEAYVLPIAIPPLAEQHRIVAKVEELMALCDHLEAAKNEREARRDRLVAASLHRIGAAPVTTDEAATEAPRATPLRDAARFHLDHLPRLTTRPEHIKQLRQTILNLAVCGRLVHQDPHDEDAKTLLRRVRGEAGLQTDGRFYDVPDALGVRFNLPEGWAWLTGEQVADFVDPQPSHRTPPEVQGGIPYIGYGDITAAKTIDFANARKISHELLLEHQNRYRLKTGDFVIGKIGTIGQPFVLPSPFGYALSANLILVQPHTDLILSKYLVAFFGSPTAETALRTHKTDSTHAVFGIKKARQLLIPLPPLAEQHRIVARIDELMALCDQLEAQLTATQTDSRRLLEAVLRDALAPALEKAA